MRSLAVAGTILVVAAPYVLAQDDNPCQSFGVDFQDGGSYFQNILSTDNFTATQEFTGCQDDLSYNVLVDPNGDQTFCNETPMTPDDTPELVTCPLAKDQMFSGEWSIIVLSNNGDAEPIDYERDFYLTVAPQITDTVTPTVTLSTTTTPVVSTTTTVSTTITSTAVAVTTTVARAVLQPTLTVHPPAIVVKTTRAVFTSTSTKQIAAVGTSTVVVTPTCQLPAQRKLADPLATKVVTILSLLHLGRREAQPTPAPMPPSAKFKRAIAERREVEEEVKAAFLQERRDRLAVEALNKRAPDSETVTITADAVSTTVTSTAPTVSVTGTTTLLLTVTTTPTVTVSSGISRASTTVTAAPSTTTNTVWIAVTTKYTTVTVRATVTVTSTPSSVTSSCAAAGGTLTSKR